MISINFKNRWILPLFMLYSGIAATAAEREQVKIGNVEFKVLSAAEVRELGFKNYPDLPRNKNAAYDYIAAMNLMRYPGNDNYHPASEKLWNKFESNLRLSNYPAGAFKDIFKDNAAMFALLEKIPAGKQCAYPVNVKAKTMIAEVMLPHLGMIRRSIRLFTARACEKWIKSHKRKAIKNLAIGYQLSASLKNNSFMISGLVQVACYKLLTNIAGDFLLSEKCDRDTARSIMAILRGASSNFPPSAAWLAGESLFGKLMLKQMFRNESPSGFGDSGLISPAIAVKDTDLQQSINAVIRILFPDLLITHDMDTFYAKQISLVKQPYPVYCCAKERETKNTIAPSLPGIRDWDIFSRMLLPALARTHIAFLKCRAHLRITIGAALLRLYQLEHKAWPKEIQVIPALAAKDLSDPFTNAKPLRYKIVGKGCILYSIGPDMKDSNGKNSGRCTRNDADDIALQFGTNPENEIETF